MSKARPTETQEAEASVPVPEPCRRHGVGQSTFYEWRSKYGGIEASDACRLKELDDKMTGLSGCTST